MPTIENAAKKIQHILVNKYVFVLVVFFVFVTFFDNHNLINRWQTLQKINKLKSELDYYQKDIDNTKLKMNDLQSSNENLEKFAREQYYMKNENEEIFIIKE